MFLSCWSSLSIIALLLLCLLIIQHGHMHLTQLYGALKLLMSCNQEFKGPNPSTLAITQSAGRIWFCSAQDG